MYRAPVAQLDRVPGYEPGGREFESLRAHHYTETAGPGLLFFFVFFGRAAPCTCRGQSNGNSRSRHSVGGGAVWVGRTRRKPIHGGSMAPSMAPTVLPTHTAPPLTDFRDLVDPRHASMTPSNSNISIIERRASTHGVDLRVDQGRHPPRAGHAIPTDCGDLSKAGWVRLRGCKRHGWRAQASMDGFTASPATGPTPPSHGMPAVALAVAVAVAVAVDSAGAGRSPADTPYRTGTS